MLSFFTKKKPSPDASPVTVIQGPNDPNRVQQQQKNNGADDFIFIERRPGIDDPQEPSPRPAPPVPGPSHMYPSMPAFYGGGNYTHTGLVYPPPSGSTPATQIKQDTPASYLQDVPFQLAPQLCTKQDFALTQMQVDGMLALMTRQMSVDELEEYNFALERSIQNECY